MKIQITSFHHGLSGKERLCLTENIINNSAADLILFSGHTINFVNDMEKLKSLIKNSKTEVVFELKDVNSSKISNCLYHIKKGQIKNLYTNQLFTQSVDINGNYQLGDRFVHELETKRKIKGLNFLIIQCGELNILKNIQQKNNRVEFRLADDGDLLTRFLKVLNDTDVILNPIHTPMGNQGKMQKRREFLSSDNRCYFSASNTREGSTNLELKSLQYAFCSGKELIASNTIVARQSISRIYDI